jgi:carboxypeptidase Q
VRGAESVRIVAPFDRPVAATALGGSIGTPPDGIEAEVVAFTGFDDLRRDAARARGKIVLLDRVMLARSPDQGYGATVELRTRGAVEAARAGAVGMVLRSLGTASFRLPHTGAMRYEDGVDKIPAAAISAEDAGMIHRLLASGSAVRLRMFLGCSTQGDAESANVVADLRGRERPEEIVLIGAHLDSWDLATGAIDDGAGVAIVMETMRLLKSLGLAPRRTLRAVLFTNEENGLRGGRAYAEAHREEWPRHVAAIESDSGGARPLGFSARTGPGGLDTLGYLASDLVGIGAGKVTKGGGGADIGPLGAGSVPLLGLRQDSTHYFDYHHSPADTLDKVDPAELDLNVAAMAVMAWSLADMEGTLPRPEPDPNALLDYPQRPAPAAR